MFTHTSLWDVVFAVRILDTVEWALQKAPQKWLNLLVAYADGCQQVFVDNYLKHLKLCRVSLVTIGS